MSAKIPSVGPMPQGLSLIAEAIHRIAVLEPADFATRAAQWFGREVVLLSAEEARFHLPTTIKALQQAELDAEAMTELGHDLQRIEIQLEASGFGSSETAASIKQVLNNLSEKTIQEIKNRHAYHFFKQDHSAATTGFEAREPNVVSFITKGVEHFGPVADYSLFVELLAKIDDLFKLPIATPEQFTHFLLSLQELHVRCDYYVLQEYMKVKQSHLVPSK